MDLRKLNKLLGENEGGGILSKTAITRAMEDGSLKIDNFIPTNLQPFAYNMRVGEEVQFLSDYRTQRLAILADDKVFGQLLKYKTTNGDGMVLRPGNLYLVQTIEIIRTVDMAFFVQPVSHARLAGLTVTVPLNPSLNISNVANNSMAMFIPCTVMSPLEIHYGDQMFSVSMIRTTNR